MSKSDQIKTIVARSWPPHWDHIHVPADLTARYKCVALARKRLRMMTRALSETRRVSGTRQAKRLSRRFFRSETARLAVAADAYEKKVGNLIDADGDAISAVMEAMPLVDPWRPAHKRLHAFPVPKLGEGVRYVYVASFVDHATQLLTKHVTEALVVPEPTQFMSSGGIKALERWLGKELPGAALVITTDIVKCFETVLRAGIEDSLPLPRQVQKAVWFDPKDHALFLTRTPRGLTPINREEVAEVSAVGRGIPQGTAAASAVSEAMIGPILKAIGAISPDVKAASYGDNLIVVLRNAADKAPALEALMSSVQASFGPDVIGPLTSRTKIYAPKDGFSFCGRFYRLSKGKVRAILDEQRRDKWAIKTGVRILDFQRSKDPAECVRIQNSIDGWATQNGGLAGVFRTAHEMMSMLERVVSSKDISGVTSGSDELGLVGDYDEPDDTDPRWVEGS